MEWLNDQHLLYFYTQLRLTTFWTAAVAIATPPNSSARRIRCASRGSVFLYSFLASRLARFGKLLVYFMTGTEEDLEGNASSNLVSCSSNR